VNPLEILGVFLVGVLFGASAIGLIAAGRR
jgi:hypothetical protein